MSGELLSLQEFDANKELGGEQPKFELTGKLVSKGRVEATLHFPTDSGEVMRSVSEASAENGETYGELLFDATKQAVGDDVVNTAKYLSHRRESGRTTTLRFMDSYGNPWVARGRSLSHAVAVGVDAAVRRG